MSQEALNNLADKSVEIVQKILKKFMDNNPQIQKTLSVNWSGPEGNVFDFYTWGFPIIDGEDSDDNDVVDSFQDFATDNYLSRFFEVICIVDSYKIPTGLLTFDRDGNFTF
jgi:hypothetical protein